MLMTKGQQPAPPLCGFSLSAFFRGLQCGCSCLPLAVQRALCLDWSDDFSMTIIVKWSISLYQPILKELNVFKVCFCFFRVYSKISPTKNCPWALFIGWTLSIKVMPCARALRSPFLMPLKSFSTTGSSAVMKGLCRTDSIDIDFRSSLICCSSCLKASSSALSLNVTSFNLRTSGRNSNGPDDSTSILSASLVWQYVARVECKIGELARNFEQFSRFRKHLSANFMKKEQFVTRLTNMTGFNLFIFWKRQMRSS